LSPEEYSGAQAVFYFIIDSISLINSFSIYQKTNLYIKKSILLSQKSNNLLHLFPINL